MHQRTCSLFVITLLLIAVGAMQAQFVSASILVDAPTFAAQCNASNPLTITEDTHVQGGTGIFSRDCVVDLAADVSLNTTHATLTSPTGSGISLKIGGADRSEVMIANATIEVNGELTVSPGHSWVTNANFDGSAVHVSNAILHSTSTTGQGVSVSGSFNGNQGRAEVVNSTLQAPGNAVFVSASCSGSPTGFCTGGTGTGGQVRVTNSTLDAGTGLVDVETHIAGKTTVVNSILIGGTTSIHGASCKSQNNIPSVPCT